jgi:N-acetyl-alpha-D-glucosaminyl L-malate synthase BshA
MSAGATYLYFPPYETALASTMVDVIKNNDLDLLHVHYAIPHASAAYMAKQILKKEGKNIPVITTLHGTDITLVGRDKTYAPVVTFSINESDAITAVSENLKMETLSHFHIEKEIDVILNFVDVKRFRKTNDSRRVIALWRKDCDACLTSKDKNWVMGSHFEQIFKKVPAKLLFVGDGPERAVAEALCRN